MPVKEVKAGMEGIGRTVFAGTTLEEFKVHILGVLENVMGPSRSLILAKLEGGPLATTGVIAGMSGSPVYIDGRLVGAVSYSLGQFPREAIAGITPIDEMVDATGCPSAGPPARRPDCSCRSAARRSRAVLQQTFARTRPFAQSTADVRFTGRASAPMSGAELGAMLRPIATPLVMGGFGGDVADVGRPALPASGFTPMPGPRRRRRHGQLGARRHAAAARRATRSASGSSRGDLVARRHRHGHRRRSAIASTPSAIRSTTSGPRSSR